MARARLKIIALAPLAPRVAAVPARAGDNRSRGELDQRLGHCILYFDCDDPDSRVGKWWWLALPSGLFIVFPLGLEFSTGAFGFRQEILGPAAARTAAVALQAIYAWMMTFGFIGLFRTLCARENKTIRYLADSSYWLYVAHVPLVIGAQWAVRDWPLSVGVKFFLVFLAVTGLLLLIYQFLVRYTWLGRLLNGPRIRPTS